MAKPLTYECRKCCGTGKIFGCAHIKAGICFSCNGTGTKHRKTRTKVFRDVWLVTSEGVDYPLQNSESAAIDLAESVECMHLEPIKIIPKQVYSYKFVRVVA